KGGGWGGGVRGGGGREASRRKVSASGSVGGGAADRLAFRLGASLSVAAGAVDRGVCPWQPARHRRALDRSMVIRAAGPAIRCGEPTRCQRVYWHRGCRARTAGRLYPARDRRERRRRHNAL